MGIENKEHEGNKRRITGAELRVTPGSLRGCYQPRGEFRDRRSPLLTGRTSSGLTRRLWYLNAPSQTSRELGGIKASKTTLGISARLSVKSGSD